MPPVGCAHLRAAHRSRLMRFIPVQHILQGFVVLEKIRLSSDSWSNSFRQTKLYLLLFNSPRFTVTRNIATTMPRNRHIYSLAVVLTIALGLASRMLPPGLPAIFGKYPGDALWALMVFFIWGTICTKSPTHHIAALALLSSFGIEILKLNQTPWLVSLRYTSIGHLIFGHVFSWQNLVAYSIGVGIAYPLDIRINRRRNP
jgi:hypothetical protein